MVAHITVFIDDLFRLLSKLSQCIVFGFQLSDRQCLHFLSFCMIFLFPFPLVVSSRITSRSYQALGLFWPGFPRLRSFSSCFLLSFSLSTPFANLKIFNIPSTSVTLNCKLTKQFFSKAFILSFTNCKHPLSTFRNQDSFVFWFVTQKKT